MKRVIKLPDAEAIDHWRPCVFLRTIFILEKYWTD